MPPPSQNLLFLQGGKNPLCGCPESWANSGAAERFLGRSVGSWFSPFFFCRGRTIIDPADDPRRNPSIPLEQRVTEYLTSRSFKWCQRADLAKQFFYRVCHCPCDHWHLCNSALAFTGACCLKCSSYNDASRLRFLFSHMFSPKYGKTNRKKNHNEAEVSLFGQDSENLTCGEQYLVEGAIPWIDGGKGSSSLWVMILVIDRNKRSPHSFSDTIISGSPKPCDS